MEDDFDERYAAWERQCKRPWNRLRHGALARVRGWRLQRRIRRGQVVEPPPPPPWPDF